MEFIKYNNIFFYNKILILTNFFLTEIYNFIFIHVSFCILIVALPLRGFLKKIIFVVENLGFYIYI